jgi:hypothetical protein
MNDMTKKERFARHVKIALAIAILCFCSGLVTAIPQQDYTLYGTATLDGVVLTALPLDSDPGVTTAAQEGDTAYVYINGVAITEGPQIIGAPSATARFDISAISAIAAISASIFQDNFDNYITGTFPSSGGWQLIYSGYGNSFLKVRSWIRLCSKCISATKSNT